MWSRFFCGPQPECATLEVQVFAKQPVCAMLGAQVDPKSLAATHKSDFRSAWWSPPLEYRYEPGEPQVSLVSPHEPAPVVKKDVYPFHLHNTTNIIT